MTDLNEEIYNKQQQRNHYSSINPNIEIANQELGEILDVNEIKRLEQYSPELN